MVPQENCGRRFLKFGGNMAKYKVHYESIVQEKYIQEIEADTLEEAEQIAEAFCELGDTSDFELDVVIGSYAHDGHPSVYSITKEGDEEVETAHNRKVREKRKF
jgi:hypothetical protein